ncbi:MAG: Tuberous sclerosis 2-like protein [Bathelium mastoideum]|nr:MAG: Tuberous sclerosis 2-like protein [Bathelium mastoideum]
MSRSGSDVTQTPERRSSSSALLDAFRSLTGSRISYATPASPSSAATLANSPSQISNIDHLTPKKESPHGTERAGVLAFQDKDVDRIVEEDEISSGQVVGGPPELQRLLRELDLGQTGEERAGAARELAVVLEEYPVQNIIAIWGVGKGLIGEGKSETESLAGFALLKACVNRPDLTAYERWYFYSSISSPGALPNLDRHLEVLKILTEQGRNIEGLEKTLSSRLASILLVSFQRTLIERKVNKKAQALNQARRVPVVQTQLKEEKTLYLLLEYIMEVTKYNAKSFSDEDIAANLDALLNICKQTRTRDDIIRSLEVMDALMTRFYIATPTLTSCLEVLCDVIHQLAELRDTAFGVVKSVLCSHLSHSAMTLLLKLVRQSPQSNLSITSLRGAIFVLHKAILLESEAELPAVPLASLLHSLRCCLAFKSSRVDRLEVDVLVFVTELINNPATVKVLIQEQDLTDLLLIIETCLKNHSFRLRSSTNASSPVVRRSSSQSSVSASVASHDNFLNISDPYDWAISSLIALSAQMDTLWESHTMNLFLRLDFTYFNAEAVRCLTDYFLKDNLLHPLREDWFSDVRRVIELVFKDPTKPTDTRVRTLATLKATYGNVEAVAAPELASKFAMLIIENIIEEADPAVLKALHDFAVSIARHASDKLFQTILDTFGAATIPKQRSSYIRPSPDLPPFRAGLRFANPLSKMNTEGVIRLFLSALNRSAPRAATLYSLLLRIAEHPDCTPDARVTALKLLFRIRSDGSHHIVIIPSIECENLAASLCRTSETSAKASSLDHRASQRTSQLGEIRGSATLSRTTSGDMTSSRARSTVQPETPPPVAPATTPAWMYPGPKGLPEEPPDDPSPVLLASLQNDPNPLSDKQQILGIGRLLEFVITILQQGAEWEVYSYVLVHLGAQLINRPLYRECIPQIKHLRNIICEQTRNHTYHEPPSDTGLKKSDVAICIFHVLTILISYHEYFGKNEQDEMVKMFIGGIGAREKTSRNCIHALSVCCHEMPGSLIKSMDQILLKMTQVITQSHIAVHILEFLAAVARLPELFKNFRDEDYKTVLGICFRYLQYARDGQSDRPMSQHYSRMSQVATLRHSGTSREFAAIAEEEDRSKKTTDDLPQYGYALAFHVITFWFMSMKIENRPKHVPYIMANLAHTDHLGRTAVDEQGEVTMDMVERVAYSDRDETAPALDFAHEQDGPKTKRTWLVGSSLLTIETAGRSGLSQITRRRPSSTKYSLYQPRLTDPPLHQVPLVAGVGAEPHHAADFVGIYPEDILQEYYASTTATATLGSSTEQPILLRDEEAVSRALSSFDRIPALDSHKVGVIYVAEGQREEKQMLGNIGGPDDYADFIEGLGMITRLKGNKMNLQGLDREMDMDGKFTYCWRDRVTEIVYHITSMMPTYADHDPRYNQKKMHVGNDFVNIIWNNSGHPFTPDSIPSQVTLAYIVITPEAYTSPSRPHFPPSSTAASSAAAYKVRVLTKPGFPALSPAAETKLVSAAALPAFVRLLALNASVLSGVWVAGGGGGGGGNDAYVSSWRARLRVIKQLRARYGPQEGGGAGPAGGAEGGRRRSVVEGG